MAKGILLLIAVGVALSLLVGCSNGERKTVVLRTTTLDDCISEIATISNQRIKQVIRNKPEEVYGYLENDEFFRCHYKRTGLDGNYWEGRYDVIFETL